MPNAVDKRLAQINLPPEISSFKIQTFSLADLFIQQTRKRQMALVSRGYQATLPSLLTNTPDSPFTSTAALTIASAPDSGGFVPLFSFKFVAQYPVPHEREVDGRESRTDLASQMATGYAIVSETINNKRLTWTNTDDSNFWFQYSVETCQCV